MIETEVTDELVSVGDSKGLLKVNVFPGQMVEVETPRAPGIDIRLVDPTKETVPHGAIYEIRTYISRDDSKESQARFIYVDSKGFVLPSGK